MENVRINFSQISKPTTTTHRKVGMKRIACTTEQDRNTNKIDIEGGAKVRIIKTMEARRGGVGF